jgi:hypothetical protein
MSANSSGVKNSLIDDGMSARSKGNVMDGMSEAMLLFSVRVPKIRIQMSTII